ncbi:MAG: RNAse [Chloroflexi bacterium]|jgi:ribonuclease Z|nr:RNAse [Chloroflexota bacterium]
MRLTFLGTSAGAPSRLRNVSAVALQFNQQSDFWLFDCGEGTQQQLMRSPIRLSQLQYVFVSHLHGDHFYGLPGMLASRSLQYGAETPVTVFGPPGLARYLQTTFDVSGGSQMGYPLTIKEVKPGLVHEDERFTVTCLPLVHRIPSYGYAVTEKPQPGHFDVEAAQKLGVPAGPLYGRLKRGESITLPDGTLVDGATLVGPPIKGRKVVYCCDTVYCENSVQLARDADVLIHEATYAGDDLDLAVRGGHSTATQAALVARQAGVTALIMTHFSPRYEGGNVEGPGMARLEAEARNTFANSYIANDFWSFDIPRKA